MVQLTRALPAIVLGVCLAATVEEAASYPTTGTTSPTLTRKTVGNYVPIDLTWDTLYTSIALSDTLTYTSGVDLSPAVTDLIRSPLIPPTVLPSDPPLAAFRYTAVLGGKYTTTGASNVDNVAKTGDAGYWLLVLDPNWMKDFKVDYELKPNLLNQDPPSYRQTATADPAIADEQQKVGFYVFLGNKVDDAYAGVPYGDTPQKGDLFWLYMDDDETMEFRWDDFVGGWDNRLGGSGADKATWTISDALQHLGPFTPDAACKGDWRACAYAGLYGEGVLQLDVKRVNTECGSASSGFSPCGSVSAVPLPAAFPLFGSALGLLALAGYRRKRTASVR